MSASGRSSASNSAGTIAAPAAMNRAAAITVARSITPDGRSSSAPARMNTSVPTVTMAAPMAPLSNAFMVAWIAMTQAIGFNTAASPATYMYRCCRSAAIRAMARIVSTAAIGMWMARIWISTIEGSYVFPS